MNNVVPVNLRFLTLIGAWPASGGRWPPSVEPIVFLTALTVASSVVVPQTVYAAFHARNFAELTECLTPISSSLILLLKMCIVYGMKGRLRRFVGELETMYKEVDNEAHVKILKKANREASIVIKWYFGVLNYIVANYCIVPLLVMLYKKLTGTEIVNYALPVKVEYGLDQSDALTYALLYFWVTFGMTALTFMYAGVDCLFASLALHVTANLKILKARVASVGGGVEDDEATAIGRLKECIAAHNRIVELVGGLEAMFTWPMVFNYLSNSFTICLVLFQASLHINDVKNLMVYVSFSVGQFVQLYMFSRYGQALIDESEAIADAAYSCAWFNYSKTFKKTLVLLIQRSQIPLGVTAAKFYYISIESFSKILGAAVSYFTLLRALNEKK